MALKHVNMPNNYPELGRKGKYYLYTMFKMAKNYVVLLKSLAYTVCIHSWNIIYKNYYTCQIIQCDKLTYVCLCL